MEEGEIAEEVSTITVNCHTTITSQCGVAEAGPVEWKEAPRLQQDRVHKSERTVVWAEASAMPSTSMSRNMSRKEAPPVPTATVRSEAMSSPSPALRRKIESKVTGYGKSKGGRVLSSQDLVLQDIRRRDAKNKRARRNFENKNKRRS